VSSVSLTFGSSCWASRSESPWVHPPKIEFTRAGFAPLTGLLTGLDARIRDSGRLFPPLMRGLEI
jgi:hypothetical protein